MEKWFRIAGIHYKGDFVIQGFSAITGFCGINITLTLAGLNNIVVITRSSSLLYNGAHVFYTLKILAMASSMTWAGNLNKTWWEGLFALALTDVSPTWEKSRVVEVSCHYVKVVVIFSVSVTKNYLVMTTLTGTIVLHRFLMWLLARLKPFKAR